MKYISPLFVVLALIQYTAPNGRSIFFVREEIIAISDAATCQPPAQSHIMTSMGAFCIRESVDEAVSKFLVEQAK